MNSLSNWGVVIRALTILILIGSLCYCGVVSQNATIELQKDCQTKNGQWVGDVSNRHCEFKETK